MTNPKEDRFEVSVETLIFKKDGSLYADLGTFVWPNVRQDLVDWLAGSCSTTAWWLAGLPEVTSGESYTIKYQTIVSKDRQIVSDTTMVEFPNLTYADVIRFEYWALNELTRMIEYFEKEHAVGADVKVKKRNRFKALWSIFRQVQANKAKTVSDPRHLR